MAGTQGAFSFWNVAVAVGWLLMSHRMASHTAFIHISGDQLFTSDMRAAEHSVFGKRHYYYPCTLKMKILEAIISRFNNE